jgi:hypothetical protein
MGLGSMFFGDPERKRREKQERDTRQQAESKHQKDILMRRLSSALKTPG